MKSLRVKKNLKDDEVEQLSSSLPNLGLDTPRKTPPVAPPRRDLAESQQFTSSENDRLLDEEWDEALQRTEALLKSEKSANPETSKSSTVRSQSPQIQKVKLSDRKPQQHREKEKELILRELKEPTGVRQINHTNVRELFEKYDTFLFDMDGVLWQGNKLITNSIETVLFLKEQNKNVYFITNNSTKSRASYVKKLKKLGLDIDKNHCFGSASMTALFLQHCKQFNCDTDRVYVIGESGILSELDDVGIQYVYDHVLPVPDDLNDIVIKPDASIKVCFYPFLCRL